MQKDKNENDTPANIEESQIDNNIFSFLNKENISKKEFENEMNKLLSINLKEKENQSLILLINKESIISMIDYVIKFNNSIFAIKLFINLAQLQKRSNSKENLVNIDFNEYILNCFKKLCDLVESTQNQLKPEETKCLSEIINNYEDILIITSDYFSKEIFSSLSLSFLSKYILKVVQEKIYTFYLIF